MMDTKRNALYAIPCAFGSPHDEDEEDSLFFLTFQTRNEKEAIRLASCVCGDKAEKALVIITQDGDIYHL